MMDIEIPRGIDDQYQVLWWEIDELFLAGLIFGAGLLLHKIVLPVILAILASRQLSKAKMEALPGTGLHLMCSFGLAKLNDEFNNAIEREFYL